MQSTGQTARIPPAPPVGKTWMPTTAGILSIVAGASAILGGIILMALMPVYTQIMYGYGAYGPFERQILGILGFMGVPIIVLGIVAIVGGVFAIRRKVWGMALAGAICSLTSLILGILSIIFVSMSRKEFV